MKRKLLSILVCLVFVLCLFPSEVWASEEESGYSEGRAYTAAAFSYASGFSINGQTQAAAAWRGTDGYYYLAISSREQRNKIDNSFFAQMDQAASDGKIVRCDYVQGNGSLTILKEDGSSYFSALPSYYGSNNDIWVILVMTRDQLLATKALLLYYPPVICSIGGFGMSGIAIWSPLGGGIGNGEETPEEPETPAQHTVTYMLDEEIYGEIETYVVGETVTLREAAEIEGYDVTPWNIEGDFVMPDEDVIISATSTIKTFTLSITYQTEEGEALADPICFTLNWGESYSITSPLVDGYTVSMEKVEGTITEDMILTITYEVVVVPEPDVQPEEKPEEEIQPEPEEDPQPEIQPEIPEVIVPEETPVIEEVPEVVETPEIQEPEVIIPEKTEEVVPVPETDPVIVPVPVVVEETQVEEELQEETDEPEPVILAETAANEEVPVVAEETVEAVEELPPAIEGQVISISPKAGNAGVTPVNMLLTVGNVAGSVSMLLFAQLEKQELMRQLATKAASRGGKVIRSSKGEMAVNGVSILLAVLSVVLFFVSEKLGAIMKSPPTTLLTIGSAVLAALQIGISMLGKRLRKPVNK